MTYIRRPLARIVSFYYWYRKDNGMKEQPLHALSPERALAEVVALGRRDAAYPQYGHFPLLVEFGGLSATAVVDHDVAAMAVAAKTAKHHLRRCLIGNTDDLAASYQLVQHYLPWLAHGLAPENLPRLNEGHHVDVVPPTADDGLAGQSASKDLQVQFEGPSRRDRDATTTRRTRARRVPSHQVGFRTSTGNDSDSDLACGDSDHSGTASGRSSCKNTASGNKTLPAETVHLLSKWYEYEFEVYHFALHLHEQQQAEITWASRPARALAGRRIRVPPQASP